MAYLSYKEFAKEHNRLMSSGMSSQEAVDSMVQASYPPNQTAQPQDQTTQPQNAAGPGQAPFIDYFAPQRIERYEWENKPAARQSGAYQPSFQQSQRDQNRITEWSAEPQARTKPVNSSQPRLRPVQPNKFQSSRAPSPEELINTYARKPPARTKPVSGYQPGKLQQPRATIMTGHDDYPSAQPLGSGVAGQGRHQLQLMSLEQNSPAGTPATSKYSDKGQAEAAKGAQNTGNGFRAQSKDLEAKSEEASSTSKTVSFKNAAQDGVWKLGNMSKTSPEPSPEEELYNALSNTYVEIRSSGHTTMEWYGLKKSEYEESERKLEQAKLAKNLVDRGELYPGQWLYDKYFDGGSPEARIEELSIQLAKAEKDLEYAKALRYVDVLTAEDFDQARADGKKLFEADLEDRDQPDLLEYLDRDPMNAVGAIASFTVDSWLNDLSYMEPTKDWSETEIQIFFYLFSKNEEEARAYGRTINERIAEVKRAQEYRDQMDWAQESWPNALVGSAASVATPYMGVAEYLNKWLEGLVRGDVAPRDQLLPTEGGKAFREGIEGYLNSFGTTDEDIPLIGGMGRGDLYQMSMKAIDLLTQYLLLGAKGMSVIQATEAANVTFDNMMSRGLGVEKASALSFANASISVLLYNYGASNVLKVKDPSTLAGYFTRLFKGTANVAAGTVAYEAFYALSDAIINEDKSEIETAVRAYISQGMSESEAREKASLDWFAGLGDNLVYNEGIYILFALLMGNLEVTKRDYKGLKHGQNAMQLPPLSEGIVPVGTESGALVPYTHPKGGLAIPGYIGPPPQSGLTPGSETLQLPSGDGIVGEDSTGYLDKPEYGGTLNIGAGTRPMEGAYNIDINPSTEGVYFGDVNDLSSIPSGSQSKIVMQNPYKFDVLVAETNRVLELEGTIVITGTLSNGSVSDVYDMPPEQLKLLGYEIVSKEFLGNIPDKGFQTSGKKIRGDIWKIVLRKIGDGIY